MTIETPTGSDSWNVLNPDPGTFTKLCSEIGVNGIQVERIDILHDREYFYNLRPIYGFMVLVKHKPDSTCSLKEESNMINSNSVYFSNQVVHDAYAMHALINILLNCGDTIDVGKDLNIFKQFTHDFPPLMKGLTLTNNVNFKKAHNNISSSSHQHRMKEIYHPISYIISGGHLWELDGLKRGPLKLGSCNEHNWIDLAHIEISKKCEMYNRQHLPATVWAVIEDRKLVYQRKLIGKNHVKREIEKKLDQSQPNWRDALDVTHWEEEYNYAMSNERNKTGKMISTQLLQDYCMSFDQLPVGEQLLFQADLKEFAKNTEDIMDAWLQIQDDSLRLYECLGLEVEKQHLYERSHIRSQHDYTTFFRSYIHALLEEGHLQTLI